MSDETIARSASDHAFERKVGASKLFLLIERLWPRLWLVIGVAGLFVLVSILGLWPMLPPTAHAGVLAAFALALLAALIYAARVGVPTRAEAIRRLERISGLAHRPASSYEDTISATRLDRTTMELWQAHRTRLAALLSKLRIGRPEPRTHTHDPLALRAALLLVVVAALGVVGDSARERLRAAFHLGGPLTAASRFDAWVTPPAHTGQPPIMLVDGATGKPAPALAEGGPVLVPERSLLVVRSSAGEALQLTFEPEGGGRPERLTGQDKPDATSSTADPHEVRYELRRSGTVRASARFATSASWSFAVAPDLPPRITLVKPPESSPRGSLKLTYKTEDDYGVASARARFEKVAPKAADPSKAWAREELKGPRRPHERPPEMTLRVGRAAPTARTPGKDASGPREAEAFTYLELGAHPWAGLTVRMTLEAKDVAGQVGRSEPLEMVLPGRVFRKPLARAIVEQRRKLLDDSRTRDQVLRALAALSIEPEGLFESSHAYLGLRSAFYRLQKDRSRATFKSVTDQLWHVALRIEDGDLSDAERALREAQEKLSKALENGASDEEVKRLMEELKTALNNYLDQLARQGDTNRDQQAGQNPNSKMLSQQDLERMMKNIENMARNGSREQAQQMLSEMRDILERLQNGRTAERDNPQGREMMKKMDELGNIVGDQQKLLDETFGEQRRQGDDNRRQGNQEGRQEGRQGQKGQQGQQRQGKGQQQQGQGQKGEGQKGQGQRGQGQQGQGQQGQGQQGQDGEQQGGLSERQGQLRDKLGQLQREMRELGMDPSELDAAGEAMESAERALREGDLDGAGAEEGRALESLRKGARNMAQEMMKNMPQRYGQTGDAPRDPLGRPQRSEGPDLGTSVKVPDEIDMQRAREILEELRRRLGETTRPQNEQDYLERLLRRF